ncbi:MAG: MBL fold metallo-hydrolase [Promethearchaeota archaeon]|jgi:glyoxylase-like metal-dependent hydrolase (beta-lactamase superfamily II)
MSEMVTNDIFIVRQEMRPGWTCNVLLVFGRDKIGIVDSGYENTPEDLVFPLIKEQGRRLDEVSIIVNTHRDGDHIRGNQVYKERIRAPIAIHELEMEAVSTADIKLGNKVKLGDRSFKVIHTPGHRPGAICLYDEVNNTLLTGDSVCGTREDLIRMDKNIYINSLRRLLELDVKLMIMSHPFGPPRKDILRNDEVKNMIEESLKIAVNLEQT